MNRPTACFTFLLALAISGGHCAAAVINEFVADHSSTDTFEFVEIFGDPSTDYSHLTIVEIEGDGGSAGQVDDGIFPVGTTDANGFWFTGYDPGGSNDIENGSITLLLVDGFTGSVGNDIDTNNDGTIDNPLWTSILDAIASPDGDAGDFVYGTSLEPGYDGNTFQVGGASRIPDGADTDTDADWMRNDFARAGLPTFPNNPAPGSALNTAGLPNVPEPTSLALAFSALLLLMGKRARKDR